MPGVRRNYWANAQILGGIHVATDGRECFARWRILKRNAANIRCARYPLLARRPPNTGSSPVRMPGVYQTGMEPVKRDATPLRRSRFFRVLGGSLPDSL